MPTVTMQVFRGEGRTGAFKEYKVEAETGMVVLGAHEDVREHVVAGDDPA